MNKHTTLWGLLCLLVCALPSLLTGQVQIGQDINGEAAEDRSGISVALSDDGRTLAVGAFNNDGGGLNSGHARIYILSGSRWVRLGGDIDGEAVSDLFGASVSLSADGRTVAIGGYFNDAGGKSAGHVKIYSFTNGSWRQLGQNINGLAAEDRAGFSVSLSANGRRVAVGAPGDSSKSGYAGIYSFANGSWSLTGNIIDGEAIDDKFGYSVSLSDDGRTVAIGGRNNDGVNGPVSGHVRVFGLSGTNWVQLGQDIDGEAAEDASGWSVSLSANGRTVAIGAINNDGSFRNAGQARVFTLTGSRWRQVGQDVDGEASGDNSGFAVALSSDGQRLAVGAYQNDGNGSGAGHTRIFYLVNGRWARVGRDIDGQAAGDQSGYSVSFSADGQTLAVGAPKNSSSGSEAGQVRVFSLEQVLPVELTYLRASPSAGAIQLDWQTATEEENAGFHVEHSSNGRDWVELAFISGAGTSRMDQTYGYLHRSPAPGSNYYRLRQEDFDGTTTLSDLVLVIYPDPTAELLIFPNPVARSLHWSSRLLLKDAPFTVTVHDAMGRQVLFTQRRDPLSVADLPTGMYTLRLEVGVHSQTVRFVKQ